MSKSKKTIHKNLSKLSDGQILQLRIKDIGLHIQGTKLEPLIQRLYNELEDKGIHFRPRCYLTDEWLTPDKIPIIGIPFYLAHPKLSALEKKMMLEAEGGSEKSFMRLIRHECGHTINFAYKLYTKTRWRELFGHFSRIYSNSYLFQPYSKRFVIHLSNHYAQSHPDEDFAETFAVWLNNSIEWNEKYKGWPAIRKLRYVDSLMKRIGPNEPLVTVHEKPPFSIDRMRSTLEDYYERKRRSLGPDFQGYYDDSLKQIFSERNPDGSLQKASYLLKRHKRQIVNTVSEWTRLRKYDVCQLLDKFISRCNRLDLYAHNDQTGDIISATSLLTAIASNTFRLRAKGRR
ncbi:MAG: putative zinc-binding metallopeptidase [Sedimentisphaerales bacterium]|nr:putative zinc-binding metallopeptidase [Sedimentisphaerales bacterium]